MPNPVRKHAAPALAESGGTLDLHGVLNIKKDKGWTSHDVVAWLRRLFNGQRIGHAGTLDPAATGVLPVLVGKGTKIAEYLMAWDKEYRAVLRLGEITDTQDATGTVLEKRSVDRISSEAIHRAVRRFQGPLRQIPPMYSAVKVQGTPLYKEARAGRTVAREAREVEVRLIDVIAVEGPDVWLRVVCSKGTYIRTLCADIGEFLGVGGHLRELERRRVGPLELDKAISVEEVRVRQARGGVAGALVSLDQALVEFPTVHVDAVSAKRVLHGVSVPWHALSSTTPEVREALEAGRLVRIKDPAGRLLALGGCRPLGAFDNQGWPGVAIVKLLVA